MKRLHGTVSTGVAFATVMSVVVACNDSPSSTTPIGTPSPVVVLPSPSPSPSPSPVVATCTLDQMPDCAADCCEEAEDGQYDDEVVAAINAVRKEKPDWFESDGQIKVSSAEYTDAVATQVTKLFGLCARGGDKPGPPVGHSISEDEVAIKRDNRSSQNIDIIYGNGQAGIIRYYNCRPASF